MSVWYTCIFGQQSYGMCNNTLKEVKNENKQISNIYIYIILFMLSIVNATKT